MSTTTVRRRTNWDAIVRGCNNDRSVMESFAVGLMSAHDFRRTSPHARRLIDEYQSTQARAMVGAYLRRTRTR